MSDSSTAPGDSRGVVVEHVVRGRTTWGTRLRADGSADEWSDVGEWRPLVEVAPDEVAAFLALARTGGFLGLRATIEADPPMDDGTEISWEIDLDGRRHRVVAREPSHARNPVLVALDAELQRIVGEALTAQPMRRRGARRRRTRATRPMRQVGASRPDDARPPPADGRRGSCVRRQRSRHPTATPSLLSRSATTR